MTSPDAMERDPGCPDRTREAPSGYSCTECSFTSTNPEECAVHHHLPGHYVKVVSGDP